MGLTMPANDGVEFELCPQGNHLAVCSHVIDLGTQKSTYEGKEKLQHKIWIGWETPGELREDGTRFLIGKRYTFSSHEKAILRKDLESWRNKRFVDSDFGPGGFEITNILGAACLLSVVHSAGEKVYANITGVGSLPKGTERPELVGPKVHLSLDPDEFSVTVFDALPEWMQKTIAASPEYQEIARVDGLWNPHEETEVDPEIPF